MPLHHAVTHGMNVEAIVAQLPAHLQLEVHLELNKKLVLQVHMFAGCAREFFDALVIKLQPCICVAGDYVFYEGDDSFIHGKLLVAVVISMS